MDRRSAPWGWILALAVAAGCSSTPPAASDPNPSAFGDGRLAAGVLPEPTAVEPLRLGTVPRSVEPWSFGPHAGKLIVTPHYRIHTTLDDDRILQRLPLFYEQALTHYVTTLGDLPMPDEPLVTYLFGDRRQWKAKTRQMLPEQAATFEGLGRGGFTTRGTAVLYYIDWRGRDRDTLAIAAHEGWHQYTQKAFRQYLPIWLEEGIATYMEGYRWDHRRKRFTFHPERNYERRTALSDALRTDRLIPLADLLRETPQTFLASGKSNLLTYYAQVWALCRFLAEGEEGRYADALEQVLSDAARGRLIDRMLRSRHVAVDRRRRVAATSRVGTWVILEYFNADLVEFEAGYLDFVRRLVRPRS